MPEMRIVLRNCGAIDPRRIESYIEKGGFTALAKAKAMRPEDVVREIKESNLRGRGGAGFPTGVKWEMASRSPGKERYVICNADEGEVGTFKDRYILQGDPFGLIEGIAIASYAIGAVRAYLYVRAEYHYLYDRVSDALAQTRGQGYLGHCDIELREGAGAYVCGEESSLMESLEGKRGEVRYRPPFPPNHGLFWEPTIINNAETLMNVVPILLNGAAWFAGIGTEQSKGTKVFSVTGDVARPGVYELPMGTPLRELVEGLAGATDVKAVQVGGASGRVLPADRSEIPARSGLDTPLAFESVLGAGAIMVFDNTRSMVELARQNAEFFSEETCGKCVPCREGTQVLRHLLTGITKGEGKEADLATLSELSEVMMLTSLCGLGQAAPNSVVDTLEHFGAEYRALVRS